jgi:hypothetical protein
MGKKGKTKYFGLFQKDQRFGKYKVIDGNVKINGEAKVTCKCDCGKINEVACYTLLKGTSKGCKVCTQSRPKDLNPAWKGYGRVPGKNLSRILLGAKNRNISVNIDIKFLSDLYEKQDGKCYYTNLPINFDERSASLERINSNIGYEESNVVWVHKNVNIMKRDLSYEEFYNICELIVKNKKTKLK